MEKSKGTAALIEAVGGVFQVFGLGHLYGGNVLFGLVVMFGYWFVLAVNVALAFVMVGVCTGPLCWIAAMVLSCVLASRGIPEENDRGGRR